MFVKSRDPRGVGEQECVVEPVPPDWTLRLTEKTVDQSKKWRDHASMKTQSARSRVLCYAAFAGGVVLGISGVAHATQQCRNWTGYTMRVTSVKVDGQPLQPPDKSRLFIVTRGDSKLVSATLYNPETAGEQKGWME